MEEKKAPSSGIAGNKGTNYLKLYFRCLARPTRFQLLLVILIILFFALYQKEGVCTVGAGFLFGYCVNEHGFPFVDIIRGDISSIPTPMLEQKVFGEFFVRKGNNLFNPGTLLLNLIAYYFLIAFFFFIARLRKS